MAQILAEVKRLSPPERTELTDRVVETRSGSMPPEIEQAQIEEVRRRIAQGESGAVGLNSGDQVFEQVRRLIASIPRMEACEGVAAM